MTDDESRDFAYSIAVALYGPNVSVVFHPERPRKQRCCILRSEGSSGGVHDMEQVASGDTWKRAATYAVLSYRFLMEERLRKGV